MAKSFNLTAPAMSFFSNPAPAAGAPEQAPVTVPEPTEAVPVGDVPAGYELRPMKKSKRLNLLVRPSSYEKLRAIAEGVNAAAESKGRMSVNELINILIEEYADSLDIGALAARLK